MKMTQFGIPIALAITIAVCLLSGCASSQFAKIDEPIDICGTKYTALLTERVNPWGVSATTLTLVESAEVYIPPSGQQPAQIAMRTQVANSNNQGANGWASGAFNGAVGDAIVGGSMMGAAALIRPSKTINNNASGSSSSASACASSQ